MTIKITRKYLVFPVNTLASMKKLSFSLGEDTVYQLNIKLDNLTPNFYACLDVSRFMGQLLTLSVAPDMELRFEETDEMPLAQVYREPMRPQIHFTTKNGWLNDPNGLIYLDGTYHMFYQYNPTEPNWENMHWGHAESRDMIHWEEKPAALFPDHRGTMYSGSAFLDQKNALGMGENTALLFYTTTAPFCQHLSYSRDHFQTIIPFGNGPVVPHILAENRDPSVVFCEELDRYVMMLYLDREEYCMLTSHDLFHWTEHQRIHMPGDGECPDIFCLQDPAGNRKWVIMGASSKYLVGQFEEGKFVPCQEIRSLHYGSAAYAGQTFSNLPGGRVVRIDWDRWGLPADRFNGQMGIPMELTLGQEAGQYYLQAQPISELMSLAKKTLTFTAPALPFKTRLEAAPCLLKLKGKSSGQLTLTLFGRTVSFNFAENKLRMAGTAAPMATLGNDLDLTMILDRCSMELYADNGRIYVSAVNSEAVSDYNIPWLILSADGDATLEYIEITALDSIWN